MSGPPVSYATEEKTARRCRLRISFASGGRDHPSPWRRRADDDHHPHAQHPDRGAFSGGPPSTSTLVKVNYGTLNLCFVTVHHHNCVMRGNSAARGADGVFRSGAPDMIRTRDLFPKRSCSGPNTP